MQKVPDKSCGDHDRPRGDLTERYAVHESSFVHPALHVHNLLEHERQRRKAPAKGEEIYLQHQQGQCEELRFSQVEAKEPND